MHVKTISIFSVLILSISLIPLSVADSISNGSFVDYNHTDQTSNQRQYSWDYTNHEVCSVSSVGLCVGHPGCYGWTYDIWFDGEVNATGSWGWSHENKMIMCAIYDVDITENRQHARLTKDSDSWVWSTDGSVDHTNEDFFAKLLMQFTWSTICSRITSPYWSAFTTVLDLIGIAGQSRTSTPNEDEFSYVWDWGSSGLNGSSQQIHFQTGIDYGQTVEVTLNQYVLGMGFEVMETGPIVLTLSAPAQNPDLQYFDDSADYYVVNRDTVDMYRDLLHISDRDYQDIVNSDSDYIYSVSPVVIRTPIVEEIEESAVTTSERMESYLRGRLKLADHVIESFTEIDVYPEYVDKVVLKYLSMKDMLISLLEDNNQGIDPKVSMQKYKEFISNYL